ncbi:class I SAM-dependent methyltransferase [Streptomyces sp. NPDC050504]|uniref:class I SAM-dependent methyltransferase n=1 Tax=Streptomyces sp. NPDC050504 TaxID=3365618 RepID=UPI00378B24AC
MQTSVNFSPAADFYDKTRGGEARGRRIAPAIAERITKDEPTLDAGMGTGVVALALTETGHSVVGIDLSHSMLTKAVHRVGNVAAAASLTDLPFAAGTFSQVYSVWVTHVVGDLRKGLSEVHRVLKPGGRYVVIPGMILFDDHPVSRIMEEIQSRTAEADDRAERIVPLAESVGFTAVEVGELEAAVHEHSPEQIASGLEQRMLYHLWAVDDSVFDEKVAPLVRELRAQPDPEAPVVRRTRRQIIVLEKRA